MDKRAQDLAGLIRTRSRSVIRAAEEVRRLVAELERVLETSTPEETNGYRPDQAKKAAAGTRTTHARPD